MPEEAKKLTTDQVESLKKRAISMALKGPAGQLSATTPARILTELAIRKAQSMDKTGSIDWSNNSISPLILNAALNSISSDWVNWLPETIYQEVGSMMDKPCTKLNMEKIRAIQTVRTMPQVGWNPEVFEHICMAFNNEVPEWSTFEFPSLRIIRYGYDMCKGINHEFEIWDDVHQYITVLMKNDGLVYVPVLEIDDNSALATSVKSHWKTLREMPIPTLQAIETSEEDPLHIQLGKLIDIELYCEAMMGI